MEDNKRHGYEKPKDNSRFTTFFCAVGGDKVFVDLVSEYDDINGLCFACKGCGESLTLSEVLDLAQSS